MRRRTLLTVLCLLLTPCLASAAAEKLLLSLADDGGTFLVSADKEYTVQFLHRVPGASYSFRFEKSGLLDPSDSSWFAQEARDVDVPRLCKELIDALVAAKTELDLRSSLAEAKANSPSADCANRIKSFEASTQYSPPGATFTLAEGQTLTLKAHRSTNPERSWTFKFTTGSKPWLVHYGFSFLPDGNDSFFTMAAPGGDDGEGAGFIIQRSNDRNDDQFEPVVSFTYRPDREHMSAWLPYFTAGLGADIEERVVFAGLAWVIGDNVNIFVGAAGQEQTRLKGQYTVGQLLQEDLAADQLVDETFDLNVIFGVGFRFNANPFKKKAAPVPTTSGTNAGDSTSDDSPTDDAPGSGEAERGRADDR